MCGFDVLSLILWGVGTWLLFVSTAYIAVRVASVAYFTSKQEFVRKLGGMYEIEGSGEGEQEPPGV